MESILEASNLVKIYPEFRLDSVSLSVAKAAGLLLQLSGVNVVFGGLALYALLFLVCVALFRFEPRKRYQSLL